MTLNAEEAREEAKERIVELVLEIIVERCGTGDFCTCGTVTTRIEEIERIADQYFGIRHRHALDTD